MLHVTAGEVVETVDDLSLPIPMERLRDMANRMNQILTNLLVSYLGFWPNCLSSFPPFWFYSGNQLVGKSIYPCSTFMLQALSGPWISLILCRSYFTPYSTYTTPLYIDVLIHNTHQCLYKLGVKCLHKSLKNQ